MICCWSHPLQFSEFRQNHYIWEVCSANQWDAWKTTTSRAGICQQKGPSSSPQQHPIARHTTNASKIEWIGLRSFASSTIFTWALANHYHFFKHLDNFLQGKCSHSQQEAESALQEFIKSWSTDFYATGISKLLIVKNVLLVMVPILINKDVFKSGYDDSWSETTITFAST